MVYNKPSVGSGRQAGVCGTRQLAAGTGQWVEDGMVDNGVGIVILCNGEWEVDSGQ